MDMMRVNNVIGADSIKGIKLNRVIEDRAMHRLSDAVITNKKGSNVAQLDSFEKSKESGDLTELYFNMQQDIYNIQSLENIIDDKEITLRKMRRIVEKTSIDPQFSTMDIQEYFDGRTDELNSNPQNVELLTVGLYDKINNNLIKRIRGISARKLGLETQIHEGRIGKITIRSRDGKSIRVSILYGGTYDREIKINTDMNTGNLAVNLRGTEEGPYIRHRVANKEIKLALEKLGYEVLIDEGYEDEFAELGVTYLEETPEVVGYSITTEENAQDVIRKIDYALDMLEDGRKDLENTEVGLKSIVNGLEFLHQQQFKDLDDALEFIDTAKIELVERPEDIIYSERFKYNRGLIENLLS